MKSPEKLTISFFGLEGSAEGLFAISVLAFLLVVFLVVPLLFKRKAKN